MRRAARSLRSSVRVVGTLRPLSTQASSAKPQYWQDLGGNLETKKDFTAIPLVDVGALAALHRADAKEATRQVVKELDAAARDVGFFLVRNHGVDKKLVQAAFDQTKQFFSQPLDRKLEISAKDTPNRGYFNLHGENLGPKQTGDYKEGVDIGLDPDMRAQMGCMFEAAVFLSERCCCRYRLPPAQAPSSSKSSSVSSAAASTDSMRMNNRWPSTLPEYKKVR